MSEELDQVVERLFRLGLSLNDIQVATNYTACQITDIIMNKGLNRAGCNVVRDRNICDDYVNGEKIIDLQTKYHIDRHRITDILRNNGVYINRQASYDTPEKQERNNLIETLYSEGNSISEVAKITNINRSTVAKVLSTLNVPMRPQHQKGHSSGTRKNAKYQWNINFFESVNNELQAYWLGFLYADGYVGKKSINLDLADKDLEHLKRFQTDLQATDIPLITRETVHSHSLHLRSVKFRKDLEKLGCVNKKTLVLIFPSVLQVPSNLINHFMRGYFDGDGCVQLYQRKNRKSPTLYFEVIGTYEFLNGFENELKKHCPRCHKVKRQNVSNVSHNIQALRYGGNMVVNEIYRFLYKDATVYLARKKSIFDSILGPLKDET